MDSGAWAGASLCLVNRGSPDQLVFNNAVRLLQGNGVAVSMDLMNNHRTFTLVKSHDDERLAGPWRYILSATETRGASSKEAIKVEFINEGFLKLDGEDLVFDVAFGNVVPGNAVNFVGGTNEGNERTFLPVDGRKWKINEDGTISPGSRSWTIGADRCSRT